ncbi:hypothetical protein [Neptuniibacter sp. QD37_11]|uniref:hypothetical protein n=1 Tax=Neptuniibacter sp. QD37_11 TaxID=3398209 RepID=UPI0039F625CC
MTNKANSTPIDQHRIQGHGFLIDFVRASADIGAHSGVSPEDLISLLKKVAKTEDKDSRELMLNIIHKLESQQQNNLELRDRFKTVEEALHKINNQEQRLMELATA